MVQHTGPDSKSNFANLQRAWQRRLHQVGPRRSHWAAVRELHFKGHRRLEISILAKLGHENERAILDRARVQQPPLQFRSFEGHEHLLHFAITEPAIAGDLHLRPLRFVGFRLGP